MRGGWCIHHVDTAGREFVRCRAYRDERDALAALGALDASTWARSWVRWHRCLPSLVRHLPACVGDSRHA